MQGRKRLLLSLGRLQVVAGMLTGKNQYFKKKRKQKEKVHSLFFHSLWYRVYTEQTFTTSCKNVFFEHNSVFAGYSLVLLEHSQKIQMLCIPNLPWWNRCVLESLKGAVWYCMFSQCVISGFRLSLANHYSHPFDISCHSLLCCEEKDKKIHPGYVGRDLVGQ